MAKLENRVVKRNKILVVDDNNSAVNYWLNYLAKAGFEVFAAYNGEATLQAVRRNRPDLMILAQQLPDQDSLEVIRIVRDDLELSHLPVIMMADGFSDTDAVAGLNGGADDYLLTSIRPGELVARIQAVLRRCYPQDDVSIAQVWQLEANSFNTIEKRKKKQ
jgi:DNA-binding response OmpR family regulator